MDKACSVSENGAVTASFTYDVDGQIATAKTHATGKQESFLWDGLLALIHRGGTSYINEPYVTGGNPILADNRILFNDMLGSTLGSHSDEGYTPVRMTAFGESDNADAFFTGKPLVGELGYTFLFRNYRPEQGKWQTTDPLGYPDGWNNLAYCNNNVCQSFDILGFKQCSMSLDVTRSFILNLGDFVIEFNSNNTICNITQHWAADLFQYSEAQTLSCGCSSECICTGEHYFASELVTNVVEGIYQTTMYFDSPLTADEIEKQMNNWKNSAMDAISTPLAEWADVTSIEKTCICE